jgi:succinate dehydrogenase / fumarate reductase flavoprotein subunit
MIDVLVIGSGGAALSAALFAKREGAKVLIVTKSEITNSQTVMAQGGINAALGNEDSDSIELHIKDTLKASRGLGNKEMINLMCQEGPYIIAWLETIGVNFSRINNASSPLKSIAQRKLGGSSAKRACYAQDYTGLKIINSLIEQIIKEDIEVLEHHFLLNLISQDNQIKGAIFLDTINGNIVEVQAKTTIVATGGYGAIYYNHTTNNNQATGDGIAAILRAGGSVSNLEFIQFHPTALKNSLVLISESARSEGGILINSNNERFVDELAPRDEVASAVFKQMQDGKEVFLDLRGVDKEILLKKLPQELKLCQIYENIDPLKELIPIRSVVHYTMGGVEVNKNLEVVGLKNCYCIGEAANANVHGANRLGGNSLLEILSFGKIAGINSANKAKEVNYNKPNIDTLKQNQAYITSIFAKKSELNFYDAKKELGDIMFSEVGIIRDEKSLSSALNKIKAMQFNYQKMGIKDKSKTNNSELIEFLEFSNALFLAPLITTMALNRKESRGAHIRSDYPNSSDEFLKSFVFKLGAKNEN